MKNTLILFTTALTCWTLNANAADLIDVYQQALVSDPTFQQAIAQNLVTKENVPISVAALLPNLSITANPTISRYGYSGTDYLISSFNGVTAPRNLTQRTYTLSLTVSQPVFNVALMENVAVQLDNACGADATLNAALQSLITRVSNAYFAVLHDEDNLSYAAASKRNYAQQLDQANQQYKVGIKTLTDVYTAQASYDTANANYIAAQTELANDRENLRVITGVYYPELAKLKDNFPLVSPEPNNIDEWVKTALMQNWDIKAQQHGLDAARDNIKQQLAGHLPTINMQGGFSRIYSDNINKYRAFTDRNGPGTTSDKFIGLNLNVPLFQGGLVVAQTRQATYQFQLQEQVLEQTIRDTVNTTRKSYNNIIAGISQIDADKQAVKSAMSSYEGFEASYKVGTETLVDVLNQQERVFQAQTSYAKDRYAFVNNIFLLKQAAGTLSFDDVRAINSWLVENPSPDEKKETKLQGEG